MRPEGERILEVYRERGLRSGSLIHPAEFGEAIVWQDGFVHDESVRAALGELIDGGYLIEYEAAFELTDRGDQHLYGNDNCVACALADGRQPLPGGLIFRTDHWLVEHCIGPLGLGTLIVKPERHVTAVAGLSEAEAAELGPLLRRVSAVAGELVGADQVYNCLWSHAGGEPGHVHYVVQPVTSAQMKTLGAHGPSLQVAMFAGGHHPPVDEIERIADEARRLLAE